MSITYSTNTQYTPRQSHRLKYEWGGGASKKPPLGSAIEYSRKGKAVISDLSDLWCDWWEFQKRVSGFGMVRESCFFLLLFISIQETFWWIVLKMHRPSFDVVWCCEEWQEPHNSEHGSCVKKRHDFSFVGTVLLNGMEIVKRSKRKFIECKRVYVMYSVPFLESSDKGV